MEEQSHESIPQGGFLVPQRCGWVTDDPLYLSYHDEEWGVPLRSDQGLFELLILEGAQAGLSWYTVLKKREAYRRAFDGFDVARVAAYGPEKVQSLLSDTSGIIRNRLKVASAIRNANAFLEVQAEFGSFSSYIWSFVDGAPVVHHWSSLNQVPARTPLSDTISQELKRRNFNFVGSTIVYSYMQATGMVMDHLTSCYRYDELVGHE